MNLQEAGYYQRRAYVAHGPDFPDPSKADLIAALRGLRLACLHYDDVPLSHNYTRYLAAMAQANTILKRVQSTELKQTPAKPQ